MSRVRNQAAVPRRRLSRGGLGGGEDDKVKASLRFLDLLAERQWGGYVGITVVLGKGDVGRAR